MGNVLDQAEEMAGPSTATVFRPFAFGQPVLPTLSAGVSEPLPFGFHALDGDVTLGLSSDPPCWTAGGFMDIPNVLSRLVDDGIDLSSAVAVETRCYRSMTAVCGSLVCLVRCTLAVPMLQLEEWFMGCLLS